MFIVVREPYFPLLHKSDFPPNQGCPVGCGLHGMDLFVNKCLIDVAFRALEEENSKLVNADVDVTISKGFSMMTAR